MNMPVIYPRKRVFSLIAPEPGVGFFCYIPEHRQLANAPLVAIHGLSRNAAEQAFKFSAYAEKFGVPIIAPLFARESHKHFQRIAVGENGARADEALITTLLFAEASLDISFRTAKYFGFSGGGQFVHRFAMLHPERVESAVLFAPGWYTYPDDKMAFPHGVRQDEADGLPDIDLERFCRIPIRVVVGSRDIARNASLNRNSKIDRLQGRNRLERARRWVGAINNYANERGYRSLVSLCEIKDAGHSFRRNVEKFGLSETVFSFLYQQQINKTHRLEFENERIECEERA